MTDNMDATYLFYMHRYIDTYRHACTHSLPCAYAYDYNILQAGRTTDPPDRIGISPKPGKSVSTKSTCCTQMDTSARPQ